MCYLRIHCALSCVCYTAVSLRIASAIFALDFGLFGSFPCPPLSPNSTAGCCASLPPNIILNAPPTASPTLSVVPLILPCHLHRFSYPVICTASPALSSVPARRYVNAGREVVLYPGRGVRERPQRRSVGGGRPCLAWLRHKP